MKENSPVDGKAYIEGDLEEHLRFYRLCGIMAAATAVFITLLMVLLFPESMYEKSYRIACIVFGPVTLVLILGMFKYPVACSWILFATFHSMLLYAFFDGTTFNLVIATLFSLFFLLGAVAMTQFSFGAARPFWLAQRGWKPITSLCLLSVLVTLISSGYALRWIELKKEDPLQWIEYRREMLNRYVNATPQDDLQDSTFKLRRVRLEGKTLVFVFRVLPQQDQIVEVALAEHTKEHFASHCREKGIREYNMKVMYVYHVGQLEHIFVMDKKDCDKT
ncbi:polysaccharide biosynthesis protein [Hafnia paralvei]|uniref:Polysaccharide biosynthesis protein n=1 Tax=Hafnia paralvei TaxID=546367 RepID=A0A4Q9EW75_9GAMM|nr:polysaccharide biosynthesis protein [Hafnia paralvei]TBM32952.1 polysaccharide biosynthesis protein [Hafnia paralvei]